MSNKQIEVELKKLNEKIDLLLSKYGASEKPSDELQGRGKAPVKRRKPQVIDFKTMYRKKGII